MTNAPRTHRPPPLLLGREASAARAALADLSKRFLRLRPAEVTGASLSGGLAGIALTQVALEGIFPGAGHAARARESLAAAIEGLSRDAPGPGLYSGLAGVAWVADHLTGTGEEEDGCSAVDEALATHLQQRPSDGPYDLIEGKVGIALYALERLPRRSARLMLDEIVDHLADTAVRMPPGPALRPGLPPRELLAWRSDPRWVPELYRGPSHVDWNLGLAHGVPGVIGLLGRVCASSCSLRTRREARRLLGGAVAWLLSQELPASSRSCFGSGFAEGAAAEERRQPSRAAWCYGDPGVAASLMVAARAVGEREWQREAVRIGLRAARRRERTAGVVDAGLCHGAAGLAHVFHRLYRASGEEAFATAARTWFARTLAMQRARGGFAGFVAYTPPAMQRILGGRARRWRSDPTFLMGAAGVALALAAAVTADDPAWDRVLLLS